MLHPRYHSCELIVPLSSLRELSGDSTIILGLINRLQSVRREDIREDGAVQWDKFEKFGEILSVISECQNRGPMVPGDVSPSLRALIENTSIIDGEDVSFPSQRRRWVKADLFRACLSGVEC